MKNWFDDSWEIHDDKGVLMKGNQDEMMFAYNINRLPNEKLQEIYGTSDRNAKWLIEKWYGDLKLIHIIDKTNMKIKSKNYSYKDMILIYPLYANNI